MKAERKKRNLSTGIFILLFKSLSIYKWNGRTCNGLTQPEGGSSPKCIYLFFFLSLFICFSCCYLMQNVTCSVLQPPHLLARREGQSLWNLIEKICSLHFSITSRLTPRPVPRGRRRSRRRGGGGDGDKEVPVHMRRERSWRSAPRLVTLKRVFRSSQCSTRGRCSST